MHILFLKTLGNYERELLGEIKIPIKFDTLCRLLVFMKRKKKQTKSGLVI